MNKPNILSRIQAEGKRTSNDSLSVAEAIKTTMYKGEELGDQFSPFEITRMLGNLLVIMEDKNTSGAVGELIANITTDIIKSEKFLEVVHGNNKTAIGAALINIGLNLYSLEDAFNKVIEDMIDEKVFGKEDMDFVMENTGDIQLNADVIRKLSELYGMKTPLDDLFKLLDSNGDDPTLEEVIALYRAGIVNEGIFYDLLEGDIITVKDLIENTNDDEFTKIMLKVKELILKESEKTSANKEEEEHNCESCSMSGSCPIEVAHSIIDGVEEPMDSEEEELRKRVLEGTITDEEISKEMAIFSLSPTFLKENISSERFERIMMMSFEKIVSGLSDIKVKHKKVDLADVSAKDINSKERMSLSNFIRDIISK